MFDITHKHKQKHITHSGANRLTNLYKYINTTCYVLTTVIRGVSTIKKLDLSKVYILQKIANMIIAYGYYHREIKKWIKSWPFIFCF